MINSNNINNNNNKYIQIYLDFINISHVIIITEGNGYLFAKDILEIVISISHRYMYTILYHATSSVYSVNNMIINKRSC